MSSGPKPDATRNLSTGIDPATFKEEANQTTEDQIGLDKGQRRDVQRRLTGLGFDTKATGQFDQATRGVIARWQAARGYPKSGYLNKLQHKALLTEIVAAAPTASSDEERPKRRAPSSGRRNTAPSRSRSGSYTTVVLTPPAPGASSAASWAACCAKTQATQLQKGPGSSRAFFIVRFAKPKCVLAAIYFPAAFRKASFMRSCQPGPPSWKYSSTS